MGVISAAGTVTNLGTLAAIASCGGCGMSDSLNADVINNGTWNVTAALTLGKVNGAYQNNGTIDLGGERQHRSSGVRRQRIVQLRRRLIRYRQLRHAPRYRQAHSS